nr:hypothetical protein [uncultured Roseateles sp.]
MACWAACWAAAVLSAAVELTAPAGWAAEPAKAATAQATAALPARPDSGPSDIAWVWDHHAPPSNATAWAVTVTQMRLTPDGIEERPRRQGLPPPGDRPVTPVVHVDPLPQLRRLVPAGELYDGRGADASPGRALNERQQAAIEQRVLAAARRSTSGWVQLDFEAVPSQRDSYHALLKRLRAALPTSTRLSVTLLAWQCRSKAWIDPIVADEVVPMFFRLGVDSARWQRELAAGAAALHPRCRNEAAGFSPQDTPPSDWQRRWPKRYWFNLARGRATEWPAAPETRIWGVAPSSR